MGAFRMEMWRLDSASNKLDQLFSGWVTKVVVEVNHVPDHLYADFLCKLCAVCLDPFRLLSRPSSSTKVFGFFTLKRPSSTSVN